MGDNTEHLLTSGALENAPSNKFANFEVDLMRIETLIDETVNKFTFAMTIPKLVDNNFELIKNHLTENEIGMLSQVFIKYFAGESRWPSKSSSIYSKYYGMQSLAKIEEYFNSYSTRSENIPQRGEYNFGSAFHLLYSKESIKIIAEKIKLSVSEAGFNFVQDIKLFLYSLRDKMKITPQEYETREAYLRKLFLHHEQLTDEAHILEEEAMEQVKTTRKNLKEKLDNVLGIKRKSENLMEECRSYIKKSGSNANDQMIFDWKKSEYEKELLEEKVKKEMIDLEMLRKKYVAEEKELRTKRYKTEQHLILFLQQYDKDMQNKQNELDRENDVFAMEKEQYEELNEQYQEQEEYYDMIMKEKEEYEQRLLEAKLYELKCSYAARKIQRFYKNFKKLIRITGKKDLLKNRKKTQRKNPSLKNVLEEN